jgi:hypothetical protein
MKDELRIERLKGRMVELNDTFKSPIVLITSILAVKFLISISEDSIYDVLELDN